ncbi:MAG: VapC toxin family PIN domain ribonuclease [Deltaproteobacteria bacterium]|nr:MAG: VapC toxin family PIN domain ribonuclease [Deltaproteobacteria bacterium]
MIAVDTNVLVFAHRTETPLHEKSLRWLRHLAEGDIPWALPVFCLGEFLRVVTHRGIFRPPSTLEQALAALAGLLQSPSIRLVSPGSDFPDHLAVVLNQSGATGNLIFDAQIAALCREHGIDTLLTNDRDFSRFADLGIVTLDREPGRHH